MKKLWYWIRGSLTRDPIKKRIWRIHRLGLRNWEHTVARDLIPLSVVTNIPSGLDFVTTLNRVKRYWSSGRYDIDLPLNASGEYVLSNWLLGTNDIVTYTSLNQILNAITGPGLEWLVLYRKHRVVSASINYILEDIDEVIRVLEHLAVVSEQRELY